MDEIILKTWDGKHSLTLKEDCLVLYWLKSERIIPLTQVVSFEVKDPKSHMRPGRVVIRLAGGSGTSIRLTSFLSTGDTNNIEFPHDYAFKDDAHRMKEYIASYKPGAQTAPASASAADEIKKFKELLDLGAISQEEYDAKKKQLLGL